MIKYYLWTYSFQEYGQLAFIFVCDVGLMKHLEIFPFNRLQLAQKPIMINPAERLLSSLIASCSFKRNWWADLHQIYIYYDGNIKEFQGLPNKVTCPPTNSQIICIQVLLTEKRSSICSLFRVLSAPPIYHRLTIKLRALMFDVETFLSEIRRKICSGVRFCRGRI